MTQFYGMETLARGTRATPPHLHPTSTQRTGEMYYFAQGIILRYKNITYEEKDI